MEDALTFRRYLPLVNWLFKVVSQGNERKESEFKSAEFAQHLIPVFISRHLRSINGNAIRFTSNFVLI